MDEPHDANKESEDGVQDRGKRPATGESSWLHQGIIYSRNPLLVNLEVSLC